jgi:hypothetical protein
MTQPVQEPTQGRMDSGQAWRTRQLFRRPGPSPSGRFEIKIVSDVTDVAVGDGQFIFAIPEDLDNTYLLSAEAYVTTVSSSGLPTVQIRNVTGAYDMLLTRITIDVSEYTSYSAATRSVIDPAFNGVFVSDLVAIDVDVAGTGAKGLGVILVFG